MMVRILLLVLASVALQAREPLTVEGLRTALAKHVGEERFAAATWGIKVVSLESGVTLFETNAGKLLKPASNAKLYSGALALDRFGPDFRIRTSLFAKGQPKGGALNGNLVVYGRGDPSISVRFGHSHMNLFRDFVAELKKAGVKRIDGDLVGDESFFRGERYGAGWTWDDLNYYYGAEVSALTVQDNVIDLVFRPGARAGERAVLEIMPKTDYLEFVELPVTVGTNRETSVTITRGLASRQVRAGGEVGRAVEEAATVPEPALWFVTMLREALEREGIRVGGQARVQAGATNGLVEIAAVASKPMGELVEKMMQPSQNLYAQLLWLQAGAAIGGGGSTEDRGARAMRDFVTKAGISAREVLLEEGSGLSRSCLVTPNATVELLRFMARHKHAEHFVNALPAPGEGTLRRRLLDLKGRLRAKTGTIRYVNSLSGYITSEAGERLAFAILLNAYNPSGGVSARDDLDVIPRLLARLAEKAN